MAQVIGGLVGAGHVGEYSRMSALVFETLMTFPVVTVLLGANQDGAQGAMAAAGRDWPSG